MTRYAGHRARQSSGSVATRGCAARRERFRVLGGRSAKREGGLPGAPIFADFLANRHIPTHMFTYAQYAGLTLALLGNTATVYGQVWHPLTSHEPMTGEHFVRLACKLSHRPYGLQVPPRWMLALSSVCSFRLFARTWRCSTSSSTTTGSSIVGKIRTGIWADGHGLPRRHRDRPGTLSKLRSGKWAACASTAVNAPILRCRRNGVLLEPTPAAGKADGAVSNSRRQCRPLYA